MLGTQQLIFPQLLTWQIVIGATSLSRGPTIDFTFGTDHTIITSADVKIVVTRLADLQNFDFNMICLPHSCLIFVLCSLQVMICNLFLRKDTAKRCRF